MKNSSLFLGADSKQNYSSNSYKYEALEELREKNFDLYLKLKKFKCNCIAIKFLVYNFIQIRV